MTQHAATMPDKHNQAEESIAWRPLPASFRHQAATTMPSVLLETSRRVPAAKSYLFTNPIDILEPRDAVSLQQLFARIDAETARGHWAAGYIAYEAGYTLEPKLAPLYTDSERPAQHLAPRLAWIGIFDSVQIFDHTTPGEWEADEAAAPVTEATPSLSETPASYAHKVQQVHEWIAAGDTYQANLTMQASWPATDGQAIYESARAAQPVEYTAWLRLADGEEIISASPELFFRRDGHSIRTSPMKGTAARGRSTEEDAQRAAWLANDEKNRAENLMIVDLLRNDLGRICEIGSIHVERLFAVESFPTVLQMTSDIAGTLRPGLGTADIFKALFPSGSIVGAPKIRTMQLLHQLEQRQRGVYTGAIGMQGPGNQSTWSVAIRTIHLRNDVAEMGVGSGLVADSNAAGEFAECQTKLAFLQRKSEPFDLIETMLWDKRYERLEAHIARIRNSAAYFQRPFHESAMRSALDTATRAFACGGRSRVRLLMDAAGRFHITTTELQEEPDHGLRLLLMHQRTDPSDVFLFHKTTRRKLYDEALAHARSIGCADALFRNHHGEITEGAIHNIFLHIDGNLITPPITCGLLPGVFRAEWMRTQSATERPVTIDDLHQAQSITMTNSVRGPRPVREILLEDETGRIKLLWQTKRI